jgi:hypothetical protein
MVGMKISNPFGRAASRILSVHGASENQLLPKADVKPDGLPIEQNSVETVACGPVKELECIAANNERLQPKRESHTNMNHSASKLLKSALSSTSGISKVMYQRFSSRNKTANNGSDIHDGELNNVNDSCDVHPEEKTIPYLNRQRYTKDPSNRHPYKFNLVTVV